MRKLILYVAMSEDGYIADSAGGVGFLDAMHAEGEDYGYAAFLAQIDTVVVGRKTYQSVLDMGFDYPHTDLEVFVFTRTARTALGNLTFRTDDPVECVRALKRETGRRDIYCEGGADLAHQLLNAGLFDEIILSIAPVLLGAGVELFPEGEVPATWEERGRQRFASGLVQLRFAPKTA